MRCRLFGSKKARAGDRAHPAACHLVGRGFRRAAIISTVRGARGARVYSEELGRDDEEQREGAGDLDRAEVQGVDLGADLPRQVGVLDLLQARAVDVPDAALPDVS